MILTKKYEITPKLLENFKNKYIKYKSDSTIYTSYVCLGGSPSCFFNSNSNFLLGVDGYDIHKYEGGINKFSTLIPIVPLIPGVSLEFITKNEYENN